MDHSEPNQAKPTTRFLLPLSRKTILKPKEKNEMMMRDVRSKAGEETAPAAGLPQLGSHIPSASGPPVVLDWWSVVFGGQQWTGVPATGQQGE